MADEDLDAAYRSDGPQASASLYGRWASDYDADMARLGYRHPSVAVALLCRYVDPGAGPVLDAGAGTGLVGELLALLGYREVDALDLSEPMLAVAASKGVYREIHQGSLEDPLPFRDAQFAAATAVGVFTTGHVSVDRVRELVRVVRPGGVVVLTVKDDLSELRGGSAIDQLVGEATVEELWRTPSYLSMPGHTTSTLSHARVLKVC